MSNNILHVLNGDCALDVWKKSLLPGESLVWREIYLEGPLPDTADQAEFRRTRAKFLAESLSEIGEKSILSSLGKMDSLLLNSDSEIVLWFDACMFDQTLLMRILHLLNTRDARRRPEISLVCEDVIPYPGYFTEKFDSRKNLTPSDLKLGSQAWEAYVSRSAEKMRQVIDSGDFSRLPFMKEALERCIDELPDRNGLSRSERQLLEIVSKGIANPVEIFRKFSDYEQIQFLGDSSCWGMLDRLADQNRIKITDENHGNIRLSGLSFEHLKKMRITPA